MKGYRYKLYFLTSGLVYILYGSTIYPIKSCKKSTTKLRVS